MRRGDGRANLVVNATHSNRHSINHNRYVVHCYRVGCEAMTPQTILALIAGLAIGFAIGYATSSFNFARRRPPATWVWRLETVNVDGYWTKCFRLVDVMQDSILGTVYATGSNDYWRTSYGTTSSLRSAKRLVEKTLLQMEQHKS